MNIFKLAADWLCQLCGEKFPGHRPSCPFNDVGK